MGSQDPSLTYLRELGYSVVRLPRRDLPVLTVGTRDGSLLTRLGVLPELFRTGQHPLPEVRANVPAASISGRQTRSLEFGIALTLLKSILEAMGGSSIGLELKYRDAKSVTFRFQNVTVDQCSVIALDKYLGSAGVDPAARNSARLLDEDRIYVVTSVLKSDRIAVEAEAKSGGGLRIGVPEIQGIVGADIEVDAENGSASTLTYKGRRPLVFGFQAVRLEFDGTRYKALKTDDPGALGMGAPQTDAHVIEHLPSAAEYFRSDSPFVRIDD